MALTSSSGGDQTWSSGITFVLAAVGAAVGLGNIWKFPYVVGDSGGGAFVLVYIACVIFVAIPILIAELVIGRRGGTSPPFAMAATAKESGRSSGWAVAGWMGLIVSFFITSYYSVIAGWTLAYIFKALNGFGGAAPAEVAGQFDTFQANTAGMTAWHTVFMIFALIIVGRGLQGGIERAVKFLMPSLFVMLLVIIGYAAYAGDFGAGVNFLFSADFSKIDGDAVLTAIGQAFFSIGVAMGLIMAYGAYVPKSVSLTRSAMIIAVADTLVALLAGLMIFPLVFANGLDPAEGPSLIFRTLPTAFAQMPGGEIFGGLFFLLLAFAAVTSLIAIIEPGIAYATRKWSISRPQACVIYGVFAWITGMASVMSFSGWSDVSPLGFIDRFDGMTAFDLIDYFTANILMPLGGVLMALFVGWRVKASVLAEELSFSNPMIFNVWLWMVRVVAPAAIIGVLYSSL